MFFRMPRKITVIAAFATLTGVSAAPTAASARVPAATAYELHPCANENTQATVADRPAVEGAVVCLINQERTEHGLPALKVSVRLDRSAQGWSDRMVADNTFSHGNDFSERITAAGFQWNAAGENIAAGFTTPFSVVRAWMADVGHCQNIMRPMFNYVGTGLVVSGNRSGDLQDTWTQDFGLLAGTSTGTSNMQPADGCPYRLTERSTVSSPPTVTRPSRTSATAAASSARPVNATTDPGPTISIG
jgi:uncharacterized protein YkwD